MKHIIKKLALLFVPVIRWLVGLPVWQQLAALF